MLAKIKKCLWGLTTLLCFSVLSPASANELLIRYSSLERAGVPGMIHLPSGSVVNTRAIRQQLFGVNFHPGDTLVWNTKTSKYTVYKNRTPTGVLSERFPLLNFKKNVATVLPGDSWFSVDASSSEMDARGSVLLVGNFNPRSLVSSSKSDALSSRVNKNGFFSRPQKNAEIFADSPAANVCFPDPPPPPLDTDGDGDPDITDPDDDGDGMTDEFENSHPVLNSLNKNDAGEDPDEDGLTNLEEFNISPLMNPDNPDTDADGIQDNIDDDPTIASNFCSGDNAILLNLSIFDRRQCAAPISVTITGFVDVAPDGNLEIISSMLTIDPGFNVQGLFLVITADPCPACPPP